MIEGDLKTIREIDRVLSKSCTLIKDSSKSGSKAYVKIYEAKGNPMFTRIRIFFDSRDKKGTIKTTDFLPTYLGVCAFTVVQAVMLMEESIRSMVEALL